MDDENGLVGSTGETGATGITGATGSSGDTGTDFVIYTSGEKESDGIEDYFDEMSTEGSSEEVKDDFVSQDELEIPVPVGYGDNYTPSEDDVVYTNLNQKESDGVVDTINGFGSGNIDQDQKDEFVSQNELEIPTPVGYGDEYEPTQDDVVYTNLETSDEDEIVDLMSSFGTVNDQGREPDGLVQLIESFQD